MAKTKQDAAVIVIRPQFGIADMNVIGTAPYVCNNFSEEAREQMLADMVAGKQKQKVRKEKSIEKEVGASAHYATETYDGSEPGWIGVPVTAFKQALVRACSFVPGLTMVKAKQSLFVLADGIENTETSSTELVRIEGEPTPLTSYVRLANGAPNLIGRTRFKQWRCNVRVKFDESVFTVEQIANLMIRAGVSVGVGAGRPDSKMSVGMGWGTFELEE